MRHRARQRKPVKTRARAKADPTKLKEGERICANPSCGRKFALAPSPGRDTYVVPALWDGESDVTDPTAYLCSAACYHAFRAEHRPRKIVHTMPPPPPLPKSTVETPSMFDQPSESDGDQGT